MDFRGLYYWGVVNGVEDPYDVVLHRDGVRYVDLLAHELAYGLGDNRLAVSGRAIQEYGPSGIYGRAKLVEELFPDDVRREDLPYFGLAHEHVLDRLVFEQPVVILEGDRGRPNVVVLLQGLLRALPAVCRDTEIVCDAFVACAPLDLDHLFLPEGLD